jgi:type VI secretion system secreted protein VgrG
MAGFTQTGRAMALTTPLGPDVLLLVGFAGREAISKLFSFRLDLLATNDTAVAFEALLGQKISVKMLMPATKERFFNGIVRSVSQGKRDETFTSYRIDVVPHFWLWTKKVQSRIFQHISVPDILKQVFAGLDVAFELQGTFHPRDYCVQYRESDYAFASRLMEEEGIYYFFTHAADGHKMIVANSPRSHRDVPAQPQVVYEEVTGGTRKDMRIIDWEKTQEVRSGKFTLWDQCFELPDKHLQAEKIIQDSAAVGKVTHNLRVANNVKLEIYDFPGAYAQRFDGVDRGGGDNVGDLRKIFEDNIRTAEIRMQQEALPSLVVRGSGDCRQFTSGHKFALQRHFNADGDYVLTSVDHSAKLSGDYRSGQTTELSYENHFTCIPLALPFRPSSTIAKPTIQGTQTAVVTGPPGEEVFCDKYGRVKVQFYWDRQGKKNGDSSCWIRVGQTAAGQGFGAITLPRIGWEVIVAFQEGDPDQPIIVGSVYNAENMPPYKLPDLRTYSGAVHRSHHGVAKNANEIRFQDQLGSELMLLHAETDSIQQAENNHLMQVGKVHRHEVGELYQVIVGKPVDVNKAAVTAPVAAAGSGAGGGPFSAIDSNQFKVGIQGVAAGSGAGGGPVESIGPRGEEVDTFKSPGLQTTVNGFNGTLITGDDTYLCQSSASTTVNKDNSTLIGGNDTYECMASASTTVDVNNTTVTRGDDTFTCEGTGREFYSNDFHQEVDGDNYTTIKQADHYEAQDSHSTVRGRAFVYEGCEFNFIPLLIEGRVLHLEANAMTHIELKMFSYEDAVIKKEGSPIKIISLG